VHADDIFILTSNGLSDNLWEEEALNRSFTFGVRFSPRSKLSPLNFPDASLRPQRLLGNYDPMRGHNGLGHCVLVVTLLVLT
jgi:hypothetical protein